jgi:GNAT superfamily N-acetyltransferase
MQSIYISTDKTKLDIDLIHSELGNKYWSPGIPRPVVETAVANSLCFGVYLESNHQQVGFARVISDFATFAYLSDVFILEQFQGQGFAKRLLSDIRAHPSLHGLRRWLLSTRDASGLYQQFGFTALAHPESLMEVYQPHIYKKP